MSKNKTRIELLSKLKACAIKAGIEEHQFISFGTLLGAIRPSKRMEGPQGPHYARGFLEWDKDADIGFLADKFHPIHREEYYHYCHEAGLFSHWAHPTHRIRRRQDNNDILWFSVKLGKQRCCQWFFFEWKNYMWHSKGKNWTHEKKFAKAKYPRKEDTQALMLGAPAKYFTELTEIDFEGLPMRAPLMSGSLLDFWYKGWSVPHKGGASSKKIVGVVDRWDNSKTWKIL